MQLREDIRDVAIVAHVDHGKTTLVDALLWQSGSFRANQDVGERVMDSMDLEREKGITILAKSAAVRWGGFKINIVDTPGHADFSGEVERVLSMVDGALLLVDANEGPMPQTRYVLMRALKRGLKPIVLLNKIDRPNADPQRALHDTFDLFLELGASDEQADFPVLYGSGLAGWFVRDLDADPRTGMVPLFETIVESVPAPDAELDAPFRMQVSTLAWSDYLGRIGCGRVLQGVHARGDALVRRTSRWIDREAGDWEITGRALATSTRLWVTRGIEREEVDEVTAGDIVWVAGFEELGVGDTIAAPDAPDEVLPPLEIEEPTVSMLFLVNGGPFAGSDGKAVTLRQIRDRLTREERVNVALRVEDVGRSDGVKVSGRGELHLAILIEEMRREGMELCVSRPEVILHEGSDGSVQEPLEQLVIHIPEDLQGAVFEKLARRKAELTAVHNAGTGLVRLEYVIPTRGLIGYRSEFLTDTRGLGIMTSRVVGYGPWRGEVEHRERGAMVSLDTGPATSYALENLQQRGTLFTSPMERVYSGMIIGESARPGDLPCNPTKRKQVTNHRSATREVDTGLKTPRRMTLDIALEWIAEDELVEVTPQSVRVRKGVLDATERKRIERRLAAL
ncbi:MAG TPA: translational GTPase TypA [Gemmatimonadota bacterium]|nr:translational GTPase TypA [Gemmatimonadota bacterium]